MNLLKKWQTIFDNDDDDNNNNNNNSSSNNNNNNKLKLNSRINYEKIKFEIQFRLIFLPSVNTKIKYATLQDSLLLCHFKEQDH
jgi:hypothetical protein